MSHHHSGPDFGSPTVEARPVWVDTTRIVLHMVSSF
jgi:hypothetical protein